VTRTEKTKKKPKKSKHPNTLVKLFFSVSPDDINVSHDYVRAQSGMIKFLSLLIVSLKIFITSS